MSHHRKHCSCGRCRRRSKHYYTSDSCSDDDRHQSIKINVDCNRGGSDGVNNVEYGCPSVYQHRNERQLRQDDYKTELLKYFICNNNRACGCNANHHQQHPPVINKPQSIFPNGKNYTIVPGLISPCGGDPPLKQTGYGYTAEYTNVNSIDQWIITFDYNCVINFQLSTINGGNGVGATIDTSSVEQSTGTTTDLRARFKNRIVVNVKNVMYGFSFLAIKMVF
jgi:hypothetical protein